MLPMKMNLLHEILKLMLLIKSNGSHEPKSLGSFASMFQLGQLFSSHLVLNMKMYSELFVSGMPLKSIDREDAIESHT